VLAHRSVGQRAALRVRAHARCVSARWRQPLRAARDLNVHRHLIYRLERIQELLGNADLEDPEMRLYLQLALRFAQPSAAIRHEGVQLCRRRQRIRYTDKRKLKELVFAAAEEARVRL